MEVIDNSEYQEKRMQRIEQEKIEKAKEEAQLKEMRNLNRALALKQLREALHGPTTSAAKVSVAVRAVAWITTIALLVKLWAWVLS